LQPLKKLHEKSSNTGEYDPVKLMGEPYEVAQEFIGNLEENRIGDYLFN
jgi:hypothetical protein